MMADVLDFNDAPSQGDKPITVALAYAARGWPVFPCNPLTKTPLTKHGFKDATTDTFQVRAWWGQHPNAMVGVPTGPTSGFWVLDIDEDKERGKSGVASLADMGHDLAELMDTVVAVTGSGGYHCLFRYDRSQPIGNARGSLKRFLDVRGDGGYIIAAGSVRADGRRYAWLNPPDENEIADAPEWLYAAICGQPSQDTGFDFNAAQRAPLSPTARVQAIEPGAWHENTRDLVARMVREGASDNTIAAIAPRFTQPGFSDDQTVREFLTHARTAREKWGYQPRNLEQEHEQQVEAAAQRFKILTIEQLINVKPPEWRIDGVLPCHGSSTLYGAYETFKTFIALDMTLSMATGRDWQGLATKACSVLYIAGEGQVGLGIRVAGWLAAKNIEIASARFQALPEAVALPHPGDQDALLRAIDAMEDPPEVIVLDTVTRMTGGGSLNDEKDAQGYVRGMDRLRIATGAHILNIGHSGKDKEKGILGSTVLPAAMETIICVERKGDGLTLINSNPKGKQKDGPNFEDIRLRTQVVGFEHHDQALKTVILMPDTDPVNDEPKPAQPLGPLQEKLLALIAQAARDGRGLGFTSLAAASGTDRGTLGRTLRRMVERGLLEETGEEGAKQWKLS